MADLKGLLAVSIEHAVAAPYASGKLEAFCARQIVNRDREENIARLDKVRIACGRLSDFDDLLFHPQNITMTVNSDARDIELLAPGAAIHGKDEHRLAKIPSKDEHGRKIRLEFSEPLIAMEEQA